MKLTNEDLSAVLASRMRNSQVANGSLNDAQTEEIALWLIESSHVTPATLFEQPAPKKKKPAPAPEPEPGA